MRMDANMNKQQFIKACEIVLGSEKYQSVINLSPIKSTNQLITDQQCTTGNAPYSIENTQRSIENTQRSIENAQRSTENTQRSTENTQRSAENAQRSIGNAQRSIGTLGEKTLHAVIKHYFEPDKSKHEIKVDGFVIDIVNDTGLIEIQTRAFNSMRNKLTILLENHPVLLVYPLPGTKWLYWIDKQTGEITKKRKSPKVGQVYDAIPELYKIRLLLNHPNLRLCIILVDLEEYRCLDGWSNDKKKGSTRYNRIPIDIVEEIYIHNTCDFHTLIPEPMGKQFTSKDYKAVAKVNMRTAQTALNILNYVNAVERVGKQGNLYIYERAKQDNLDN